MAEKERLAVKTVAGDNDLTLTADAGESLLVRGIEILKPDGDYLTIRTEKTTVGYFRVGGGQGNHLYPPAPDFPKPNLLSWLIGQGILAGYPIAEGETMTLTGAKAAAAVQQVTYSIHDAGDMKPEMPNGSQAKEYFYVNYGRFTGVLADGSNLYTVSQTPVEFPGFPFGEVAPAGKEMTLHGIAFSPIGYTQDMGANWQFTTYVKLLQDRVVLHDAERNGLPARGYMTGVIAEGLRYADRAGVFGNLTDLDQAEPLMLEDMVYNSNEELLVYVTTSVGGGVAKIAAQWAELAFLFTVKQG